MTIAQEEIFGPVVTVIPYDDEHHGVAIANDSAYGLSGSVWGPDVEHAKDIARRIRSGNVAINQHTLDLGGPFGDFKESGLGREYGLEGSRSTSRSRPSRIRGSRCSSSGSETNARAHGLYGVLVRTVRVSSSICSANRAATARNAGSANTERITAPTALASSISQMSWTSLRSPIIVLHAPTSFQPCSYTIGLALAIVSLKAPSCPYFSLILEWR
jgi:delta 1-pyrroline-5-carboxylate dehydrogenase